MWQRLLGCLTAWHPQGQSCQELCCPCRTPGICACGAGKGRCGLLQEALLLACGEGGVEGMRQNSSGSSWGPGCYALLEPRRKSAVEVRIWHCAGNDCWLLSNWLLRSLVVQQRWGDAVFSITFAKLANSFLLWSRFRKWTRFHSASSLSVNVTCHRQRCELQPCLHRQHLMASFEVGWRGRGKRQLLNKFSSAAKWSGSATISHQAVIQELLKPNTLSLMNCLQVCSFLRVHLINVKALSAFVCRWTVTVWYLPSVGL